MTLADESSLESQVEQRTSADEVYRALVRSLRRRKGFGIVFVQCSPRRADQLVKKLQEDIPNKNTKTIELEKNTVNLYKIILDIKELENLALLFIRGIERSLEEDIGVGYGGEGYYYNQNTSPRILSHLNQQRERFRDDFPHLCIVFLIPFYITKYFVKRAPDFFDWSSGVFEIDQNFRNEVFDFRKAAKSLSTREELETYLHQGIRQGFMYEPSSFERKKIEEAILISVFRASHLWAHNADKHESVVNQVLLLMWEKLWSPKTESLCFNKGSFCIVGYLAMQFHRLLNQNKMSRIHQRRLLKSGGGQSIILNTQNDLLDMSDEIMNSPEFTISEFEYSSRRENDSLDDIKFLYEIIHNDPTGELKQTCLHLNPNITAQKLLIKRGLQAKNWKEISTSTGIPTPRLSSFYTRRCIPLIRKVFFSGIYSSSESLLEDVALSYGYNPIYFEVCIDARNLLSLGYSEKAIAKFDEAIRLEPDLHIAWKGKGNAFYKIGAYKEAVESYSESLRLKPSTEEDYDLAVSYANSLYELGEIADAVAAFNAAILMEPRKYLAYLKKAEALENQKNYVDAAISYGKVGRTLIALGRYNEALVYLEKSLEIKSQDVDILYDLARAYFLSGLASEALGCMAKLANIDLNYQDRLARDPILSRFAPLMNEIVSLIDGTDQRGGLNFDIDSDRAAAFFYDEARRYAQQEEILLASDNLRLAIELAPEKYIPLAKHDSDFDCVRGDKNYQQAFEELLEV